MVSNGSERVPDANGLTLFSNDELDLLGRIASADDLKSSDIVPLLDLERRMEHMGRRHGIHQEIRARIGSVAEGRIAGRVNR
jgi:hypothetical protein